MTETDRPATDLRQAPIERRARFAGVNDGRRDRPLGRVMTRRSALLAALLAAFFGGLAGVTWSRWDTGRALRAALLQNDLLEARAALLHARVSLYEGDLVDVTRQLEDARAFVERAAPRAGTVGTRDPSLALELQATAAQIDDAKRLVATLASPTGPLSPR